MPGSAVPGGLAARGGRQRGDRDGASGVQPGRLVPYRNAKPRFGQTPEEEEVVEEEEEWHQEDEDEPRLQDLE
eukprot:1113942-Alexandrium_andersonii.AAC.1